GRAHPMIDPTLRNHAIVETGRDPRIAVLLLDFILGFGAHPDPAGATLPAIREALAIAAADGRQLAVLGHIVGTDADPQGLARQATVPTRQICNALSKRNRCWLMCAPRVKSCPACSQIWCCTRGRRSTGSR